MLGEDANASSRKALSAGRRSRATLRSGCSDAGGTQRTGATRRTNAGSVAAAVLAEQPALTADVVKQAQNLFDAAKGVGAREMSLQTLQEVLSDAGHSYTPNEVRDLVAQVRQTASVEKRNARIDAERMMRAAADGAASVGGFSKTAGGLEGTTLLDATTAASQAPPRPDASDAVTQADTPASDVSVDFATFLHILTLNLTETNAEAEYRRVWAVLDADGDGVLRTDELAAAVAAVGLPPLCAEELASTLGQADYDCDGEVRLDDFLRTMDST